MAKFTTDKNRSVYMLIKHMMYSLTQITSCYQTLSVTYKSYHSLLGRMAVDSAVI